MTDRQTDRDHGEHGLHDGDGVLPVVVGKVVIVDSYGHDPPTQRLHNAQRNNLSANSRTTFCYTTIGRKEAVNMVGPALLCVHGICH